ncbi:MAG: ATP-binding protein [Candidatus Sumerlaeia bacterium]
MTQSSSLSPQSAQVSASAPLQAILVSTLQNLTLGVLAVSRDGLTIVANPAACALLERPLEETAGTPIHVLLDGVPGSGRLLSTLMGSPVAEARAVWTTPERHLEFTAVRARAPWDAQLSGLVLIEDKTEWRRLEHEAALRSRLTGMGAIAIELAHEIRNPLGSIALFADTLERELAGEPSLAALAAQILAGVKSLEHLVANTLQFARPRRLAISRVSLAQVLADALIYVEHPLLEKNIKPDFDLSRAPQACIAGDAEQLRQVFLNLFLNAVQAMDEGGTLAVRLVPDAAGGGWQISVHDDGHGIAPEIQPRIFDPFFTTREKGSGIGLAVVHSIVVAHGGRVEVDSAAGKGTTFRLTFPERLRIEEMMNEE